MSAERPAPRGLIFDLDGTLLDAFADIAKALNLTRAQHALPPLPVDAVKQQVGRGSAYLVQALVPLPPSQQAQALTFYLARYAEVALESTRLLPGAKAVLEHFRARPLAVITNKPQAHTRAILEALGLWSRFRIVLGGDALPRAKPDPLPVRRVLEAFALPADAVAMIGDSVHDVQAGRAAGVRTVAVTSGVQSREALLAAGPDHLIERLDALLELFD